MSRLIDQVTIAAVAIGAVLASPAAQAAIESPTSTIVFGAKLSCSEPLERSPLSVASRQFGTKPNAESMAWVSAQLSQVGFGAKSANHPAAQQIANLLQHGNVVAAKMVNDEAAVASETYRNSKWFEGIESLVTILTQPVSHASYPTSVRAAGEHREAAKPGLATYGSDLEATSDSLSEVIGRAALAKKALGPLYAKPSMRFYMLANGFRDPVAYVAAAGQVCAMKLNADDINKVDVTARLMAMPFKREFKEGARQ